LCSTADGVVSLVPWAAAPSGVAVGAGSLVVLAGAGWEGAVAGSGDTLTGARLLDESLTIPFTWAALLFPLAR